MDNQPSAAEEAAELTAVLAIAQRDAVLARQTKLHYEQLELDCQARLGNLSRQSPSKRRRSAATAVPISALSQLKLELDKSKKQVTTLSHQNDHLNHQLETRLKDMANDAGELEKLRKESVDYHELQIRYTALHAEQKSAQLQLQRSQLESEVRQTVKEESINYLRTEIRRLTEQLTQARHAADTAASAHSASLGISKKHIEQLAGELAQQKAVVQQQEEDLEKSDSRIVSLKNEIQQQRREHEEEYEKLQKISDLQKELAGKAEQRVSDYEEIIKTLKEEIVAKNTQYPQSKARLVTHAEVLIKNLQEGLEQRMTLLQQQKEEMERARASEMAMRAKQENMNRDLEDSKWEREQMRKEVTRLKEQVKEQARKISQQERKLQLIGSDAMESATEPQTQSPSSPGFNMFTPHSSQRRLSGRLSGGTFGDISGRLSGKLSTTPRISFGPTTTIPVYQPADLSPMKMDFDSSVNELDEIRMRQEKVLSSAARFGRRSSAFSQY